MRIKELFSGLFVFFFLVSITLTLPVDYELILKREVNGYFVVFLIVAANVKG